MKNLDYHCSITVAVTAREAEKKINQVSAWWAKNMDGKAEKLDDQFTVRFGETFVKFRISEYIPGKKVVWLVTDCLLHWQNDKTEWTNTQAIWELSENKGTTQINFTHQGLVPEVECYSNCVKGWDQHIKGSLHTFLAGGMGQPS